MIRALLATGAVALGGSVGFPPPASNWLLWLALTAAGLVLVLCSLSVLNWLGFSADQRDARRRASWR